MNNPHGVGPDVPPASARRIAWLCALVIALGAFLLFQVQPIISKVILPRFGGSPGVWTACLLFFQTALLAGYAYAHCLVRVPRVLWQVCIHAFVIVAALFALPIATGSGWSPPEAGSPTWRILVLLTVRVGLPYFVLAATSPLIQAWYARTRAGGRPYRFYAVSNAGSLMALVSYPFLVEPALPLATQGRVWSVGFMAFAAACVGFGVVVHRRSSRVRTPSVGVGSPASRPPSTWDRLSWFVFPALATTMLLATTHHISQDVAVVPLLWVLPLSIYLISFMVCFGRAGLYRRGWVSGVTAALILVLTALMIRGEILLAGRGVGVDVQLPDLSRHAAAEVLLYLAALAAACLLCHGEVARRRPAVARLTGFYLALAAGGAAGGAFVALVCPLVFSALLELRFGLVAVYLLAVYILVEAARGFVLARRRWFRWTTTAAIVLSAACVAYGQRAGHDKTIIHASRSFYGVLAVGEHDVGDAKHLRALYHGRIMHGAQMMHPTLRRVPTTYYGQGSGVGVAFRAMRQARRDRVGDAAPLRIGAVGLGVGTVAAYSEAGDVLRFYEIDPAVVDVASRFFTFLGDSPADVQVAVGDARISMQAEEPQRYDVLVLDAFNGDAPPLHLLTVEAFDLYARHTRDDAVIAVNTTNRYVDYTRVMASLAKARGLHALRVVARGKSGFAEVVSSWVLISGDPGFVGRVLGEDRAVDITQRHAPVQPWTDEHSSLVGVLLR